MRVEVPKELWAGESRPIFATLNGKYNDGTSKLGDVPWTYPIEWQFAEPVWEEEGSGDDITYTPRPPETPEEYVPSQILTGGHRIKHDTSPLYVGDMTSSSCGLVYVRAVMTGVSVTSGEVTQGYGVTSVSSAWIPVRCIEHVYAVTLDGTRTDDIAMFKPDDGAGRGKAYFEHADVMQSLTIALEQPLDKGAIDTVTMRINHGAPSGYVETELTETGNETQTFEDAAQTITLVISDYNGLDDDAVDSLDVALTDASLSIVDENRRMTETSEDSNTFGAARYSAVLWFPWKPTSSVQDVFVAQVFRLPVGQSTGGTLAEYGTESSLFMDNVGLLVVELASAMDWSPEVRDTLRIRVTSIGLDLCRAELELKETAKDSMVFSDHFLTGHGDGDALEPTDTTLIRVRARRWPGVFGEMYRYTAVTPFDFKDVDCTPKGDGTLESVLPLVAVGPGYESQMEAKMSLLLGQEVTVLVAKMSLGNSATEGRDVIVANKTFIEQADRVKWTGVYDGKSETFKTYTQWKKWAKLYRNHAKYVTKATTSTFNTTMTSDALAEIKPHGIVTFAWSDHPDSSEHMKVTVTIECSKEVRQYMDLVTEEWEDPINADILLKILENCGTWPDGEDGSSVLKFDPTLPAIGRKLFFFACHGGKTQGNIAMYGAFEPDGQGGQRAVYTEFGPEDLAKLDPHVFHGRGSRALNWTTLSACEVAHKLTSRDNGLSCQDLRDSRYVGLDREEDPPSPPNDGKLPKAAWLETVFQSQVILGWDGLVDTGFAQDFWKDSFKYMCRERKSIGWTLQKGGWAEGEKGATRWMLILRVLRHPEYDKNQEDAWKWYWPNTWPPHW
ncbi:MAG: hypothetical protein JW889_02060 [Verrucomicrobia bacterium]|nr:hypothetical protein [Verrucomicrobiota bacterium]